MSQRDGVDVIQLGIAIHLRELDRHAPEDPMCGELNRIHLCSHDISGNVGEAPHEKVLEYVLEQSNQI